MHPAVALTLQAFDPRRRELGDLRDTAVQVRDFAKQNFQGMTEAELGAAAASIRADARSGKEMDLVEGFALIHEAARTTVAMEPRVVQHEGAVAGFFESVVEMKTGEGKTLVVAMNAAANALSGMGVHTMTANDYLATRDAGWMGSLFARLGLSVGVVLPRPTNPLIPWAFMVDRDYYDPGLIDPFTRHLRPVTAKVAYECDITYGRCSTYAHDYLFDNRTFDLSQKVQRGLESAVVDEVDFVMIDDARTPNVISQDGAAAASTKYLEWAARVARLEPTHFRIDHKYRLANLTLAGEKYLGMSNLTDGSNPVDQRHVELALQARVLQLGKDYLREDDEIVILDTLTGRAQRGRRWRDGLHQAIEAKEGVTVHPDQRTLDGITVQNFLHRYQKLSGFTGTIESSEQEFLEAHRLKTVRIGVHLPSRRRDLHDLVYATEKQKIAAVVAEAASIHKTGRPVLIGTTSVIKCKKISEALAAAGLVCNGLHAGKEAAALEARLVALAGCRGAITVATNMAGRGTDILLGGNPDYLVDRAVAELGLTRPEEIAQEELRVKADWEKEQVSLDLLGGLHVIGTERNDSRRVDNQLRGRGGRGGNKGTTRFIISLEDELFRTHRKEAKGFASMANSKGLIENPVVHQFVNEVQRKVETRDREVRRHLVAFDRSINQQRDIIYAERQKLLDGEETGALILKYLSENIANSVDSYYHGVQNQRAAKRFRRDLKRYVPEIADSITGGMVRGVGRVALTDRLFKKAARQYLKQVPLMGEESAWRFSERWIMLKIIDDRWVDHLAGMEHLREQMELRAYGQQDPWNEHAIEAHRRFEELKASIKFDVVAAIFSVQARSLKEQGISEQELATSELALK